MKLERAFKGVWIPREVWLDETLGWTEKLLLVEINSLDNEEGCWASNEYFAEFFSLSKDRISKLISSLKNKGYLTVDLVYKKGTRTIEKRVVKIADRYRRKQLEGIGENNHTPIGENAEDNNTGFNNTVNNTKELIPYVEIVSYLNTKTSSSYKSGTQKTKDLIKARWNEGHRLEDFKSVIDKKVIEWKGTEYEKYLVPNTLFGTKFEGYLNQKSGGSDGKRSGYNGRDSKASRNYDEEIARRSKRPGFIKSVSMSGMSGQGISDITD
jgi:uncharacterized phage protein (TIGR02220 family)